MERDNGKNGRREVARWHLLWTNRVVAIDTSTNAQASELSENTEKFTRSRRRACILRGSVVESKRRRFRAKPQPPRVHLHRLVQISDD